MKPYQEQFIHLCLQSKVLGFGEFILKSGRKSPYFFNAGLFNTGNSLSKLGHFYAEAIHHSQIKFDMLFGPAYKGITLAATTAIALAEKYKLDKPYAFNRKEEKNYGEGGQIIGHPLLGQVLIIDDVITAGTAITETITIIQAQGAKVAGIVIALDRQEKGNNHKSALIEISAKHSIPVISIITLENLLEFLQNDLSYQTYLPRLINYKEEFGTE